MLLTPLKMPGSWAAHEAEAINMEPGGLCERRGRAGECYPVGAWAPSWDALLQLRTKTNYTAPHEGAPLSRVSFFKSQHGENLTARSLIFPPK